MILLREKNRPKITKDFFTQLSLSTFSLYTFTPLLSPLPPRISLHFLTESLSNFSLYFLTPLSLSSFPHYSLSTSSLYFFSPPLSTFYLSSTLCRFIFSLHLVPPFFDSFSIQLSYILIYVKIKYSSQI